MQHKFTRQSSIKESLFRTLVKIILVILFITFMIFLLDKINFPSPTEKIKEDITNEIIKLK